MFNHINPVLSKDYGVSIVVWEFGAWKTKNAFAESILKWKIKHPNGVLIANVPYDWVDFLFNNRSDFDRLMTYIVKFIRDTNDKNQLEYLHSEWLDFKDVLLIIDETQTYFFSRNYANNIDQDLLTVITQCRKRNIQMLVITQNLNTVDKTFRLYCPDVIKYKPFAFWIVLVVWLYFNVTSTTDISNEYEVEITWWTIIPPDWLRKLILKNFKSFVRQRYLTKYVVWFTKELKMEYEEFYNLLLNHVDSQILGKFSSFAYTSSIKIT